MVYFISEETPDVACVADCSGKSNGDYQSCLGCHVYLTCSNGVAYDNRLCPGVLVWDDNLKYCNYESATCPGVQSKLPG